MIEGPAQPVATSGLDNGQVLTSAWPRLLSVKLAAAYLGIAPKTITNRGSNLPGRKRLGRRILFDRVELDKWIERNNGRRDLWVDAQRMTR